MSAKQPSRAIWTPANVVTVIRICLVPVFVVALLSPWPHWFGLAHLVDDQIKSFLAVILFIIISCTDWVDGYLARSRQEVTDFGKFMDPLADKILVSAALLAPSAPFLAGAHHPGSRVHRVRRTDDGGFQGRGHRSQLVWQGEDGAPDRGYRHVLAEGHYPSALHGSTSS